MGLLAPSISYADPVDEENKSVTLHGSFGSQQVAVYAGAGADGEGGAALESCLTGGETVKCHIDPAQAGHLVAEVNGVRGNAVPLTEWDVTLTYRDLFTEQNNAGNTITFNLHVRADVHRYRTAPGQNAPPRSVVPFKARSDSGCQFQCDGTITPNGGGQPLTFSGGGSMPLVYTYTESSAGASCTASGLIDLQNNALEFFVLSAIAPDGCALTAPDGTSFSYTRMMLSPRCSRAR